MKTTTVRKLLPDSWGFLCPVHTPDGGPCGLLNHMAVKCETQTEPLKKKVVDAIPKKLVEMGMEVYGSDRVMPADHLVVCLDGRIL